MMGVDHAVVCLSVVLSTPMNVIWRLLNPLYNCVSSPSLSLRDEKQETGICGLADAISRSTNLSSASTRIHVRPRSNAEPHVTVATRLWIRPVPHLHGRQMSGGRHEHR